MQSEKNTEAIDWRNVSSRELRRWLNNCVAYLRTETTEPARQARQQQIELLRAELKRRHRGGRVRASAREAE